MPVEPFLSIQPLNDSLIRPVVTKLTRQWVDEKVSRISYILDQLYFGKRRHKSPPLSPVAGATAAKRYLMATSFSSRAMRKGLGGSANSYKKYLEPFSSFPDGKKGFSRFRRTTKAYYLRPEIEMVLTDYWRQPGHANPIDKKTGSALSVSDLPETGIVGSPYATLKVRPLLVLDAELLDTAIAETERHVAELENIVARFGTYARLLYALRHLYAIRKWQTAFGGIPNIYREKKTGSGRLSGVGRIHMQRLPKTTRRLLLKGSGYWDFDFVGCHWFITQCVCRHYGIESPVMDEYLAHKNECELELAERLGLPVRNGKSAKTKKLLLGMLMNQTVTTSPFSSLSRELGIGAVRLAQQDDFIQSLKLELKVLRAAIIKRHTFKGIVTNQLGKTKPVRYRDATSGKIRKTPGRKLFSHILQGYEAWALNSVLTGESETLVLMFDGWISENEKDTNLLEAKLRNMSCSQLGFALNIKIKGERL